MIFQWMGRFLVWAFWVFVPHPFVSKSEFASAICGRCGFQHYGKWW